MMEWQPIATAPKDGRKFLSICYKEGQRTEYVMTHLCMDSTGEEDPWWFGWSTKSPSHWMPLPEPPKERWRKNK